MSEPFAKVERFGSMYELNIGNGRMHNKDNRKIIVQCWADAINDDFEFLCAAREREAAAKALEEAAHDEVLHVEHGMVVDALKVRQMLRARAAAKMEGK